MNRPYQIALGCILVVALILGAFTYETLHRIDNNSQTNSCVNGLIADLGAGLGHALAAPPAPNAARTRATHEIHRAADRLAKSAVVCG